MCVFESSPTRIFSSSPLLAVCCFSSRSLSWEQIWDTSTQRSRVSSVLPHTKKLLFPKRRKNEAYGKSSTIISWAYNLSINLSCHRISHSPRLDVTPASSYCKCTYITVQLSSVVLTFHPWSMGSYILSQPDNNPSEAVVRSMQSAYLNLANTLLKHALILPDVASNKLTNEWEGMMQPQNIADEKFSSEPWCTG